MKKNKFKNKNKNTENQSCSPAPMSALITYYWITGSVLQSFMCTVCQHSTGAALHVQLPKKLCDLQKTEYLTLRLQLPPKSFGFSFLLKLMLCSTSFNFGRKTPWPWGGVLAHTFWKALQAKETKDGLFSFLGSSLTG